jgi:acetamidase/formamidase
VPKASRSFGVNKTYYLSSDNRSFGFDNSVEPGLTVTSGDTVVFQCREAYDGQVTRDATLRTVQDLDWTRLHAVTGPVAVQGAEPGDVLMAELLDFEHEGWGYTAVFFPVEVEQALLSVGDGHLAQGDGEVCGIAIEAPVTVTIRLSILEGRRVRSVECDISGATTRKHAGMGYHVTTAAGLDLHEGAQNAVREMIDYLHEVRGLTRTEAYMLCSVAGDLKIAVPVMGPGHASNVTFHMPLGVF